MARHKRRTQRKRFRRLRRFFSGFRRRRLESAEALDGGLDVKVSTVDSSLGAEIVTEPPGPTDIRPAWRPTLKPLATDERPFLTLVSALTTAKDPLLEDANEDAYAWLSDQSIAAIFDGATESFAAKRWVEALKQTLESTGQIDMEQAQGAYAQGVETIELSWAQEQAIKRGSFTTLVKITTTNGGLHTTLVGDSALILYKDNVVVDAYPYSNAYEYSSVPEALSSSLELLPRNLELIKECTWTVPVSSEKVDTIVLATDAVAAWLLHEDLNTRSERIRDATTCEDNEQWRECVEKARQTGEMKVDDSTICIFTIGGQS